MKGAAAARRINFREKLHWSYRTCQAGSQHPSLPPVAPKQMERGPEPRGPRPRRIKQPLFPLECRIGGRSSGKQMIMGARGEAVLKPFHGLAGGLSFLVCFNSSPGLLHFSLSLSLLLGMFGKAAGCLHPPPPGSVAVSCMIIDSSANTFVTPTFTSPPALSITGPCRCSFSQISSAPCFILLRGVRGVALEQADAEV